MSAVFYYFVARAMMVTYVVPPVGVVLGGGLIFLGIAIVNIRLQRFFARQPVAEQVAKP